MEGGGSGPYKTRTVEEVFRDFKGRRTGMIKALTTDVNKFYQQCDPEKENLCLYGLPNETWEVNLPAEEFTVMHGYFLSHIIFGARFGFDKNDRKRLFQMINDLPTVYEQVSGLAKKQQRDKSTATPNSSSKSKSSSKTPSRPSEPQTKGPKLAPTKDEEDNSGDEEEEDEHGGTLCGACGDNYASDEFWICCDICERWFHGKCVKVTPARAEHIKQYKCPACTNKRVRV